MTRVARCKYCGRVIMAVSLDYIEDEDIEELKQFESRGYEIIDLESKDFCMARGRCYFCPPRKDRK